MDRYQQLQSAYGNASASGTIGTGDSGASLITGKVGFITYIQKLTVSILTPGSSKELVFEDDGTPTKLADIVSASVVEGQVLVYDFGPNGFPCAVDKDFKYTNSGLAVTWHVEAYQKRTTTVSGNTVGGGTPGNNHS